MLSLNEFLLARIAEEVAAARSAMDASTGQWSTGRHSMDESRIEDSAGEVIVYDEGRPSVNEAAHIARHDPARVLAECEVKRRIVELHSSTGVSNVEWWDAPGTGKALICPTCRPEDPTESPYDAGVKPDGFVPAYTLSPCDTLRTLGLTCFDHAEYRGEWRP